MTNIKLNADATLDEMDGLLHPWFDMIDAVEDDAKRFANPERRGEAMPVYRTRAECEQLRRDLQKAQLRFAQLLGEAVNLGKFYDQPVG